MTNIGSSSSRFSTSVQVAGIVVGIIAILTTGYFSIRSERSKELTITYLSKRPLLVADSNRSAASLEVRVAGGIVKAPWLLSGRLENTGSLPIEAADIESPVKINFENSKALTVDVVRKSQESMPAQGVIEGEAIVINHRLLNPSDQIDFDIVFDGEPLLPPKTDLRISGVTEIHSVVQPTNQPKARVALLELPRPLIVSMLLLSLFGGMVFVFAAMTPLSNQFRALLGRPAKRFRLLSDQCPNPQDVLRPSSPILLNIFGLIGRPITLGEIDAPTAIENLIRSNVPQAVIDDLNTSPALAAAGLSYELKQNLRENLATHIYIQLPKGVDAAQRSAFANIDIASTSASDILVKAKDVLANPFKDISVRKRVDFAGLTGGTLALLFGISVMLLIGGTLRNFMGF